MKSVSGMVTLACLLNPCSPIQNERSKATSTSAVSVCTVQREPERFVGRSVWLSGQLEGDGMHWITLTDASCHEFGLEIKIAKDFDGTRDYLTILGGPRALVTIVRGEFFGYVRKKARVLVLKKADHVEIQPKKSDSDKNSGELGAGGTFPPDSNRPQPLLMISFCYPLLSRWARAHTSAETVPSLKLPKAGASAKTAQHFKSV